MRIQAFKIHHIQARSPNALGTVLKYDMGIPDHDDFERVTDPAEKIGKDSQNRQITSNPKVQNEIVIVLTPL